MIIATCTDDRMVEEIASNASTSSREIFGKWFKVFEKNIPDLRIDENLFIVAHGAAYGDEDQPVIGSKSNDFYLTGRDLNSNLQIFPDGYRGGVFIYACESAKKGAAEVSFVETYAAIISHSFPTINVYGQTGKPSGPLPGPNDHSWTRA